jgi:hypothetical protein
VYQLPDPYFRAPVEVLASIGFVGEPPPSTRQESRSPFPPPSVNGPGSTDVVVSTPHDRSASPKLSGQLWTS